MAAATMEMRPGSAPGIGLSLRVPQPVAMSGAEMSQQSSPIANCHEADNAPAGSEDVRPRSAPSVGSPAKAIPRDLRNSDFAEAAKLGNPENGRAFEAFKDGGGFEDLARRTKLVKFAGRLEKASSTYANGVDELRQLLPCAQL